MSFFKTSKGSLILILLVLLIASAVAYLPLIGKMGYSNDDWYLMYDAHVAGPQIYHDVFSIDRPARAYLQIPLFGLFGENVIPYYISLYLFRLLGALTFFWLLTLIWPRQRMATFTAALLFLIYPGFLAQTTPIDYQAHLASLFLGLFSIALTVKAILPSRLAWKITLITASILTGIAYLSLMEYFIGLEVLRLGLIVLLIVRNKSLNMRQIIAKVLREWLPILIAPLSFLIWRLFFFQSVRRATNVGLQVGQIIGSPIYKILGWLTTLIQSIIKVIFLAWAIPLNDLAFQLRLRDLLIGLLFAIVVALMVAFASSRLSNLTGAAETSYNWKKEAWLIGSISVIGGLLPIIVSNRQPDFGAYSRYTLTSSAGGVIIWTVLLSYLKSRRVQIALIAILAGAALLAHYANSVSAANASETIRNFWWQVYWRAPQFKDGTTFAVNYPQTGIAEDYFIWGPASFIYSPEKQTTIPISIRLSGIVLTQDNILNVLTAHGQVNDAGRGNISVQDFGNVTVIAQSMPQGCIRIMDGSNPEISSADAQDMMLIAPHSQINNVILDRQAPTPPSSIFGSEPSHEWCYYYEKAELARQRGDWKMVDQLGDEALNAGFYPSDRIEWMPFLQSYVALGEREKARHLVSIINSDPFTKLQACQILNHMPTLSTDMHTFVQQSFCQ
jgi:hypothetical protein